MRNLPPGWVWATLGDVAETRLGKMLSAKARSIDGGRAYLRNKNVQWGRIDVDDLLRMDFSDEEFEKFRLREGDLLVCEGGEVGRAAIWKAPVADCAYQKALHRVRPRGGIPPEYLLYLLMHYADAHVFERYITGSTIAHLPQEDLRELPVPLAPLTEQRRVVAAIEEQLSRLEASSTVLDQASKRLLPLEIAVYANAFRAGTHATIGDVASLIRGVTYKKHEARPDRQDGYLPLLRATNINGELRLGEGLIFVPTSRVRVEQLLCVGDLVIATSSGSSAVVGKSGLLVEQWEGTFGAFCGVLRPSEAIDPRYLAVYCGSPTVRRQWSELARGTNINNLRVNHILATPIPVPELEAQKRVAQTVEAALSHISTMRGVIRSTRQRSESLRRAVLARAFGGRLVPQDPDEEPASVLLERIAAERAAAAKPARKRREKKSA